MSLDFLRRNLGLKILSIILAVFLWAYVKYSQTPYASSSSQAEIRVPLTLEGKDDKLVALNLPPDVKLTVKGEANTLSSIDSNHFKAYLDVNEKKAGKYHLKVKFTTPPGIKSARVFPETVVFRLDPLEKRLFNVKVKPQGTIASGFIVGVPEAQPQSITVSGAQSIISKVKEVQAVCDLEGADMDRIQQAGVEVVDENGQVIKNLTVEPVYVRIMAPIKSEVTTATVPIKPALTGSPAAGYSIGKIEVTPPVASIRYNYNMESPPKVLMTEAIPLDNAKTDLEKEAGLAAPKDVSLVSPEKVKVTVHITKTPPEKENKGEEKGKGDR